MWIYLAVGIAVLVLINVLVLAVMASRAKHDGE
jgi:hypothetical protein